MTTTETGKPWRSASATAFSTSAWLSQRLADIHGPKTQSGGSTGGPKSDMYSAIMRSGVPENSVSPQPPGSSQTISPSLKSKAVVSQVSAYSPKPESVQKNGAGQ